MNIRFKTFSMATSFLLAVGGSAVEANAAVTIFDVTGTLRNGSELSGTLSIDTASGVQNPLTALNLTVSTGNNQFAGFTTSSILSAGSISQGYYQIEAGSQTAPYVKLILHTDTLVGYTGGPLCSDFNVAPAYCGFSSVAYAANGAYSPLASGGLSPRAGSPAVPEPATWAMMIIGFAAVGFALRRKAMGHIGVRFA